MSRTTRAQNKRTCVNGKSWSSKREGRRGGGMQRERGRKDSVEMRGAVIGVDEEGGTGGGDVVVVEM
jgi:hypothetical protein